LLRGKNGGTRVSGTLWMQQHVMRMLEPLMRLRLQRVVGKRPESLRRGIEAKS
jgi:hypothetical protein